MQKTKKQQQHINVVKTTSDYCMSITTFLVNLLASGELIALTVQVSKLRTGPKIKGKLLLDVPVNSSRHTHKPTSNTRL